MKEGEICMKITRRLLALLLALCLTFGNVMPAMATELTNEEPAAVENTTQLAEEPESTEGEVSGTVGIEDNPFDETEAPAKPIMVRTSKDNTYFTLGRFPQSRIRLS